MSYRITIHVVSVFVAGLTLAAHAQVQVGPQSRVDVTGAGPANETTISVHGNSPLEVLAGANDYGRGGDVKVGFGISLNGGTTYVDGALVPPPPQNTYDAHGDPMTCWDPATGDFWMGGIVFNRNFVENGIYVARKPAGATSFNPAVVVTNNPTGAVFDDKCLIAAGPTTSGSGTMLYVTFTRFGATTNIHVSRSATLGASWLAPVDTGFSGQGSAPVVLSNGTLVIAYWNFGSEIRVLRSTNGGVSFSSAAVSGVIGVPDGGEIPGAFRTPELPGIAVDPSNDTIYVAYSAEKTSGSTNVDVRIARSTDGGLTFPTVVALPDPAIRPTADQFFPWVAVDALGGVNVLYYDTRHTAQSDGASPAFLDAYYTRITGFGTGSQVLEEHRLTSVSFNTGTDFGDGFIGDYQQIAAASVAVYPCYMSTHEGHQHYYTHKIIVGNLPGDMNCDLVVDGFDVDGFVLALTDPAAYNSTYPDCDIQNGDTNGDGSVNGFDVDSFVDLLTGP
ncbi:MAG: hypothetical protein CHACPFDD_02970 [Phycisphaerae bacterium]|nr:hypothetical protein [Phycisphaerae bacterium]